MAWFLSPSGWPTHATDGSLFAASLTAAGWTPLNESDVPAAIAAYNAGQPLPPGSVEFVTVGTTQTITGAKDFTTAPTLNGGPIGGAGDATATTKGLMQLAGHLGGTAAAPEVVSGAGHGHTAAQVSDSTPVGRSVLTAVDAPTARAAIGAGTSSLAIGTTAGTAKSGDYAPPTASELEAGLVPLATAAEVTAGLDGTKAVTPAGLKVELDKKVSSAVVDTIEAVMTQAAYDALVPVTGVLYPISG